MWMLVSRTVLARGCGSRMGVWGGGAGGGEEKGRGCIFSKQLEMSGRGVGRLCLYTVMFTYCCVYILLGIRKGFRGGS